MRFTYEMKLVRSERGSRYDMIKVRFPGAHKQFGECRHGINGAVCDPCKGTGRFRWIDGSVLHSTPSCRWCGEEITVFDATGWSVTRRGERGCWYLRIPLHIGCLMDGEPSFHTYGEERGSTAVSRWEEELWMGKEADRAYYPEVRDILGASDDEDDMPFNDERWVIIAQEQRELNKFNSLCGPVTCTILEAKIKCGNCKNRHATAQQVKACYTRSSPLLKEKEGK